MRKEVKNTSHAHENILSLTNLRICFLSYTIFFVFVYSSAPWLNGTQHAYFSWESFSFSLFSLCLFPLLLYLSLSLIFSFDSQRSTFNGSYLLIKYLQVSAVLWQGDKERWRQREGAVAGVVQALSDMTYSQIPCAKFELLMSPEELN